MITGRAQDIVRSDMPKELSQDIQDQAHEIYKRTKSVRATAREMGISEGAVRNTKRRNGWADADNPQNAHKHSDNDYNTVAADYALTGSYEATALHTGYTERQVAKMLKSERGIISLRAAISANKSLMDANATLIIQAAGEQILDRLQNGDASTKYDDEAKCWIRKPISARDAAIVMGVAYDKRALQRGDDAGRVESSGVSAIMSKLAEIGAASLSKSGADQAIAQAIDVTPEAPDSGGSDVSGDA